MTAQISKMNAIRVAVIMGGPSKEHDVSIASGAAVAAALRESGMTVDEIVITEAELPVLDSRIDVVFPALHGAYGEDGQVQQCLEARCIPYVGSDAAASRDIIDKTRTKSLLEASGIRVPKGVLLKSSNVSMPANMRFPVILKPNTEGSTIGLLRVDLPEEWAVQLAQAFRHGHEIVAEEFVSGTEITVGVLDGEALPTIEIVPPGDIFDYDAKYIYSHGQTQYLCPPLNISSDQQLSARRIAEKAYDILNARDMLRVDMIVDRDRDGIVVLEANSIPGFTENSLLPKAAAAANISFSSLCRRLVSNALMRGRPSAPGEIE